jgi:hypothetical protein
MLLRHIGNADSRTAYYKMSAGVGNVARIVWSNRRRTIRSLGAACIAAATSHLVSHSVAYSWLTASFVFA